MKLSCAASLAAQFFLRTICHPFLAGALRANVVERGEEMLSIVWRSLVTFAADEDGAITVDYVVLTAGIVLLGVFIVAAFDGGAINLANEIGETVRSQETNPG
ncbi:Flp family type IVb pilin [Yoonia sp. BS5-3]|uniref:Flp family type IVb pilin n=1 Tax=Yoonia phaeophyticola TaxID=3137369 RepID=A0ABZ2V379_9RHOB